MFTLSADLVFNRWKFKKMHFVIFFKVVISGKYKNLNKITKIYNISLKFHRLLIFVILHSLQCKIEGHAV